MKTYLKGIKTIAIIFLSLALFSCQEEQIVPIDTLSRTTDGNLSEKGKPPKGDTSKIYYTVSLVAGTDSETEVADWNGLPHPNELVSNCDGTVNSVQTLLWFNDCTDGTDTWPAFTPVSGGTTYGDLNYGAIRPDRDGVQGLFGLRMTDSEKNNYYFSFDGPEIDLSANGEGNYPIYRSGTLQYKDRVRADNGKGWEMKLFDTNPPIKVSIGIIIIERIP